MVQKENIDEELHYCTKCNKLIYKYITLPMDDFPVTVMKRKDLTIYHVVYQGEFCSDCYTPKIDTEHF